MGNITVNKASEIFSRLGPEDPVQLSRALFNWSPLRQIKSALPAPSFTPAFEVMESRDRFVFRADMPGVQESELEVTMSGNCLAVAGSRQSERLEEGDTIHAEERTFGAFSRSFLLPDEADVGRVQAALTEGVLTVVIPKIPDFEPRTISRKAGGS